MKILTIIEDNPITGVVYGTKEIADNIVRIQKMSDLQKIYQQQQGIKHRCAKHNNTKNK